MNNEKIYTAVDFESYYAGTMPAQDMHALEKAALEDPFLADALDGYTYAITPVEDIKKIKERLNPKKEKELFAATTNNKNWWRAAAAVIGALGLGVLFFTVNKKESSSLADNKIKQDVKIDTAIVKENKLDSVNKTPTLQNNNLTTISSNTISETGSYTWGDLKPEDAKANIPPNGTTNFSVTPQTDEGFVSNPKPEEKTSTEQIAAAPQTFSEEIKNKDAYKDFEVNNRSQNNRNQMYYNYNGVVQTPTGGPMQNATLRNNTNNVAIAKTDNQGRYNFKANDSTLNVSIAAIGYEKKETILNNTSSQVLTLDDKNLDAVVVNSTAVARKKSSVGSSSTNLEKGLAGKVPGVQVGEHNRVFEAPKAKGLQIDSSKYKLEAKSFYSFVKQNIKPEFDENGNEYKGAVTLSFTVNKKGEPRKIKIEKSLNDKCDNQAIELLETGPDWFFPTSERRTVVIVF
jgi:outer membrane biosynthesis protein TonB